MIKNMELNFIKNENGWVAEFEASADFNLHIDGVLEGNVQVYQRGTTSGGYSLVRGATPYPTYGKAYDFDFSALVYPKFIKVVCATEPSYAEVVSDGEVTELKFQEKEVEVSNNGTTTVTPDTGFAALNSVKLKVNVPQSSGNTMEYIDISGLDADTKQALLDSSFYIKAGDDHPFIGVTAGQLGTDVWPSAIAVGIDFSALGYKEEGYEVTIKETFIDSGFTEEQIASFPRITKEEFFTL